MIYGLVDICLVSICPDSFYVDVIRIVAINAVYMIRIILEKPMLIYGCNDLTEALNAYLECFFLDFTTTLGCEDCD